MRIKNTLNHLNKLIDYNSNLNEAQKNRLRQTPFKWVVDMTDHIKVSGPLLEELLSRWDSISHGFRVGCKTVAFAPADVCIALGLQIVGTTVPVPLNDNSDCRVKSLFNGEDVTIDSILQKLNVLNTEQDIEDFCRVYILFSFFALYFPKKSRNVTSVPFKLLDDLNLLETYNWGQAVYEDLVESINTAAGKYAQSGGDPGKEMTLSGCSAILQIWVVEKLQLCDISAKCFPRINKWTTLPYHGNEMQNIFANAKLVEDLVPTEEDQQFNVVAEAVRQSEFMHADDVVTGFDATTVLRKQQMLFDHNKAFRERISVFAKEMNLLKEAHKGGKEESQLGTEGGEEESELVGKEEDNGGKKVIEPVKQVEDKKRRQKLIKQLYQTCTNQSRADVVFVRVHEVVMRGHIFECMKPRGWLSSLLMSAATQIMMGDLLKNRDHMKRFIITHAFSDDVIANLPKLHHNPLHPCMTRHSFTNLVSNHLRISDDPIEIMRHCNLIFAPTIQDQHWFCYVLDKIKKKLFVLNSLYSERNEEEKQLDLFMKRNFENLLHFMDECQTLELVYEDLPQQKNIHDCGIYVLKYLEMWDGDRKWGDKTMPDFTLDEILHFRRQFVCEWVLHPQNLELKHVRVEASLPDDFSIDSLQS